jgi:DNA-binding LacI/PurR family transcriptional regulator
VLLLSFLPESPGEMYRLPALPALLGGVQDALLRGGQDLLLAHCPDGVAVPPALAAGKVDGVVAVGRAPRLGPQMLSFLEQLPVVWTFHAHNDSGRQFDHVVYNNRVVGVLAAEHFQRHGHRWVAVVNAEPGDEVFGERRDAFVETSRHLGLGVRVVEPPQPLAGHRQFPFFVQALGSVLASPGSPTALFCVADSQMLAVHYALGAIAAERDEPIELLGCNHDDAFLDQIHPRPATIDIRLDLVGREAAELLQRRLGGLAEAQSSVEILVRPVLIAGQRELAGRAPRAQRSG